MLSVDVENNLCNLIAAIADCEFDLEAARSHLAEIEDFEPYAAFLRLDKCRFGYVTAPDIVDFLAYSLY